MSTDYTGPNPKKDKKIEPPPKVVEKVVTVEVIHKKKPIGRQFKEIFFGGDFKSATRYVAADVLLPALRNLVFDTWTKAAERVIYGESVANRRRASEYRPYVQYNNPISRPYSRPTPYTHLPDQPRRYIPTERHKNDGDQLVITNKREAELVVERLMDIIDKYDVASVADLYDLIGDQSTPVDNKWGWTSLNQVEIRQTRDGYLIDLPQAEPI